MTKRALVHIEIGISDAKDYWSKIVIPAWNEFQKHPSAQTGMASASSLWHIHEWVWYDKYPEVNTWHSDDYKDFCAKIITECPELDWLHVVTNIGKHRALTLPTSSDFSVTKQSEARGRGGAGGYGVAAPMAYGSGKPQLRLHLRGGSAPWLEEVCERAVSWWKARYFP
jgi:hypothetical protein